MNPEIITYLNLIKTDKIFEPLFPLFFYKTIDGYDFYFMDCDLYGQPNKKERITIYGRNNKVHNTYTIPEEMIFDLEIDDYINAVIIKHLNRLSAKAIHPYP